MANGKKQEGTDTEEEFKNGQMVVDMKGIG